MFEIEELTPHGWRHELEVEDSRQAFWIARERCDQKLHPYRVSDPMKKTIMSFDSLEAPKPLKLTVILCLKATSNINLSPSSKMLFGLK